MSVNRGMAMPLAAGFLREGDLADMLAFPEDRAEGIKAFAEKREPDFEGQ